MVDVAPFRALRYITPKYHNDISKLICPPYDVISPEEREELTNRSILNVIQLELPSPSARKDKYAHAAELLHEWQEKGLLQEDRQSAFYLLETLYRINDPFATGKRLKRSGVLAALRLEPPGKGAVHPHEKTLPKAKEDRFNLLTALQTNVSAVFGLFFDTKNQWGKWITKTNRGAPLVSGGERNDLTHRLWKIDDPSLQKELRGMLKKKDLFIADGHHRYEVSWAYKEACLKENPSAPRDLGFMSVMTYICPIEDPGLLMLPTHRLVRADKTPIEWRKHLETVFDLKRVTSINDIVRALSKPKTELKQRLIGWVSLHGCFLLKLKSDISMDLCLAHRPKALRGLDAVLLHDLALGEAPHSHSLKEKDIIYTRDTKEIQTRIKKDPSWVAFLLAPAGVKALAEVALAREVMPPKTTYFYPKVPTGFTLMPLNQRIK
jgi:uncharacterized protein (DUF1015 family)